MFPIPTVVTIKKNYFKVPNVKPEETSIVFIL